MTSCQQLDLLPICCSYCNQHFCKTHFQPSDHSCAPHHQLEVEALSRNKNSVVEMHGCSLPDCSAKELVQMPCTHCTLHFCLQHRHQVDHQCSKLEKSQKRMVQTAALVKQIQNKNSGKKISQGVKSDKLAAKVQLMKLKQNSRGTSELPVDERVYFLVHIPDVHEETFAIFVSKCWSVGKSIDYIATASNTTNYNNIAGKPHLNLFTSSGTCLSEQKEVLVSELIAKEIIFNGQTIFMKYIEQ